VTHTHTHTHTNTHTHTRVSRTVHLLGPLVNETLALTLKETETNKQRAVAVNHEAHKQHHKAFFHSVNWQREEEEKHLHMGQEIILGVRTINTHTHTHTHTHAEGHWRVSSKVSTQRASGKSKECDEALRTFPASRSSNHVTMIVSLKRKNCSPLKINRGGSKPSRQLPASTCANVVELENSARGNVRPREKYKCIFFIANNKSPELQFCYFY